MKAKILILMLAFHGYEAALAEGLQCGKPTFKVLGLERTDESWFRDYLQLGHFEEWSPLDSIKVHEKIMTTDIFTAATVDETPNPSSCEILIEVKEKWTRIPVVRGAYGGGTPLLILGGYETNTFGRLMAMGGEIRRYGRMAPGAFFFFKSPRAWRGRGLWGGELWLDRRRRDFFDSSGELYGYANSESWTAKIQWLYPLSDSENSHWQGGFQSQLVHENPTLFFHEEKYSGTVKSAPADLHVGNSEGYGGLVAPMLAYDNLTVNGLNYSGLKWKMSFGVSRSVDTIGKFSETEAYMFHVLPGDINLAGRLFAASTSESSIGGVYYLGGFDSVRGLPDGIHYGNNIVFGNFEARVIAAKLKYAHIQPAVFVDSGTAWMRGLNPAAGRETSFGGGVRIAIPQIYRFVIRVDYGVSVGATKSRGLSVGLNQFFQPYKLVF